MIVERIKLKASDGKEYLTDCANTEILFRIIQTIPSPKAEPSIKKNKNIMRKEYDV